MQLILLLVNLLLVLRTGMCSQVDNFGQKFQQEADSPWTPMVMNHAFQPDQSAVHNAQVSSQIQRQPQTPQQHTRNILPAQHAPPVVTQQTHRLIPLSPVVVAMPIEARAPAPNKRQRNHPFLWSHSKKPNLLPPPKRDLNKKMNRREPMRKIGPSSFLKKIARKVFFPDRRSDNHGNRRPQQHRSPPGFRFDQNGKVLFPQAQTQQQQFDTNRLRLAIQQALCAFSTASTGMNGESCIES